MKRSIVILLGIFMILGLASCGKQQEESLDLATEVTTLAETEEENSLETESVAEGMQSDKNSAGNIEEQVLVEDVFVPSNDQTVTPGQSVTPNSPVTPNQPVVTPDEVISNDNSQNAVSEDTGNIPANDSKESVIPEQVTMYAGEIELPIIEMD